MTRPRPQHLYTIRYRRSDWTYSQQRVFKRQAAAERLIAKLRRGRSSLSPIVELTLERQELGPVEILESWEAE